MLKPLKTDTVTNTQHYVVADIENYPNGDVLTIDVCWRELGRIVHKLFTRWKDFWAWLRAKARNDKRFRIVYAHNGGGWDWLSLAYYLLNEGEADSQVITGICAASKLITMTVQIGSMETDEDGVLDFHSRYTIHFCDSLQLLRSKLEPLAVKFGVTHKIDLGGKLPHEIYETDKELFWRYVEADTESLLQIMEKSNRLLNEKVAPIGDYGYTIGSTAMKVFRTMLPREIPVPYDEKVKAFLRAGYKGGRVEVFQTGYFPNVTIYDINSLYPYAMLTTEVPVSDRGLWVNHFHASMPGCYHISFRQTDESIPPVLMVAAIGAYEGEGHYFTPEIALLREVNPSCEITVHSGYVFLDREKIFQDFVNRLYTLRLEDKDGPVSLLAKFLLNSLYGKFAQNPIRRKIIKVSTDEALYKQLTDNPDEKLIPIDEDLRIYELETHHAAAFEHVGIAGMITSRAREILYRGILQAGKSNVAYCDTDSVHVISRGNDCLPPVDVSSKIGAFKKEFYGEGCYVGKKLYALRESKWCSIGRQYVSKIRAKGVTIGGRNGSDICFADFVRLSKGGGETYRATYQSPATAKQVFKGTAPCRFEPKTRTLRRTTTA